MPTPAQQILMAVLTGDAETVAELLTADPHLADLADRTPSRDSVLHHAAGLGHLAIVELLLAAGAAVDRRAHDGSTPLHAAAYGGHAEVVRVLLAVGAETRATTNSGCSPYDAARLSRNPAVIELLQARPRPINPCTFRGKREWS